MNTRGSHTDRDSGSRPVTVSQIALGEWPG